MKNLIGIALLVLINANAAFAAEGAIKCPQRAQNRECLTVSSKLELDTINKTFVFVSRIERYGLCWFVYPEEEIRGKIVEKQGVSSLPDYDLVTEQGIIGSLQHDLWNPLYSGEVVFESYAGIMERFKFSHCAVE